MTSLARIERFSKIDMRELSTSEIFHECVHLLKSFQKMHEVAVDAAGGFTEEEMTREEIAATINNEFEARMRAEEDPELVK